MKPIDDLQMVWSDFQETTNKYISNMGSNHDFSDVTLACDDLELFQAHKVIISAGSQFFETILRKTGGQTQPLVYLRGVSKAELEGVLAFLYTGQTRVSKLGLDSFLALARDLGVRGFAQQDGNGITQTEFDTIHDDAQTIKTEVQISNDAIPSGKDNLKISSDKLVEDQLKDISPKNFNPNRSAVWNYADKVDSDKCKCNLCGNIYNMKSGTTSGMRIHLTRHHADIPEVAKDFAGILRVLQKKHKKSPVWKYSEKTIRNMAKCLLCGKLLRCVGGSTSDIRGHLLNYHYGNQDVVNALVPQVQKEHKIEEGTVFEKCFNQKENEPPHTNYTLENGMPPIKDTYEDGYDSNEMLASSHDAKIPKTKIFKMKNFIQKINRNECVCLLCEYKFVNKSSLKYQHLIQEHSDHESIEPSLIILKNNANGKRSKIAEKTKDSVIWEYFNQDQQHLYAKCKLCACKVFELREGVMKDLANHLYIKHPEKLPQPEDSSIDSLF